MVNPRDIAGERKKTKQNKTKKKNKQKNKNKKKQKTKQNKQKKTVLFTADTWTKTVFIVQMSIAQNKTTEETRPKTFGAFNKQWRSMN